MKSILVLGGTGFVGAHVCEKLVREGWRVTVPTRRLDRARAIQVLPRLQPVCADVHDAAHLAELLRGHDAVVNLVAILHGDEAAFEHAHVRLPATLAAACQASGVRRLVHISALGADPAGPSRYQRSKARGEAVLQEAARAGALDLTVLRPSVIFGAGDRFLNLFADLQRLAPVLPLAGANCRFQPVWVEDVAEAVVRCLRERRTAGLTFELAGPDVMTLADLVRAAARWSGAPVRPVIPLPAPLARAQAWIMEHAPGEPLMSRDNLDSMRVDNVALGHNPGLVDLGIRAAPLAGVAPTYLGQRGPRSRLDELRRTRR